MVTDPRAVLMLMSALPGMPAGALKVSMLTGIGKAPVDPVTCTFDAATPPTVTCVEEETKPYPKRVVFPPPEGGPPTLENNTCGPKLTPSGSVAYQPSERVTIMLVAPGALPAGTVTWVKCPSFVPIVPSTLDGEVA